MSTYGRIKFSTLPKINGQHTVEARVWYRNTKATVHAAPDLIGQGSGDTADEARTAAMASVHTAEREEAYRAARSNS